MNYVPNAQQHRFDLLVYPIGCGSCVDRLYMDLMSSESGRWWSLSSRRRRVAIIATVGSGLLALVVAGWAAGWSDWRDVVGVVCPVVAIAALVTTNRIPPMVDDRRRNLLLELDRRTKRRALRCIRRGDRDGAPVGISLEQVAFLWGDTQVRSLRVLLPMALLMLGDTLRDGALWFRILGIGLALVFLVLVVYGVRDVRLCRRFLISAVGGSLPRR